MKTTWNRLASLSLIVFTGYTLHAQTYFLQSLGGVGSVPYPLDPYHGTVPMTEVSSDIYVIEDGDSESLESGGMMTMDSIDPTDPGNTNGAPLPTPPPNIRNYAKYSQQTFALLDTNSVLNDVNDTNLYNACVAINGPTNGLPWLTITQYGSGAVIIRADNFDYSETNADFALLVCDKVETPTWKTIDFGGASDAQDGWLVQGTVPRLQVTSTMFLFVTNLNTTYNAFFRAIPYSGPQVAITGTNQPYDIVSNIIMLTTQIYDLSGTTNEQFLVDVNGDATSTRSSLSNNTITLDTKYNPNGQDYGIDNVDLTAQGFASVYANSTNPPADTKLFFTSATSIPLDFENVNYLLFQSFLADRDIGTNTILFVCNKEEDITCTITDPSNNVVIASYGGHIPGPEIVGIPWDFTEADGVTPYSNSTYIVHFIASDPDDFLFPNQIPDNDGVRKAAGCYITYEQEPTITTLGEYTDEEDNDWLDQTLVSFYQDLYRQDGITEYLNSDIGPNRAYGDCQGLIKFSHSTWADFMGPALSNSYTSFVDGLDYPRYSDLTIGGAHGTGTTIGGYAAHTFIPWLSDEFTPPQLQSWLQAPNLAPQWRLRKAALWACLAGDVPIYTVGNPGPQGQTNSPPAFPDACGIRPTGIQMRNYVMKNCAWVEDGLLPQLLQGPDTVDASAEVAAEADQLWVSGPNEYPGGCDPTYCTYWVVTQMQGLYPILAQGSSATLAPWGYIFLPYTSVQDAQIEMLNHSSVKGAQ